jgi:flagellar assembly protein FliH
MSLSYRVIKNGRMALSEERIEISPKERMRNPSQEKPGNAENARRRNMEEELQRSKEEILREVLEQAKADAQKIREDAYKEGYRDGMEKGRREGLAEAEKENRTLKEEALQRFKTAEEEVEKYYRSNKKRLLELAGTMAQKILDRELTTSGESLLVLVKPLLQEYKEGGLVVIGCHKHRIRICRENLFALKKINPDVAYMVIENPDLEEDQVLVEYQNRIIDLDMKNQIQGIIDDLVKLEG